MALINYSVTNFSAARASQGALVVMVDKSFSGDSISNVTIDGGKEVKTTGFGGAGICRIVNTFYTLTVDSVVYTFNSSGTSANSDSAEYKLMMGEVTNAISTAGNAVDTASKGHTTRSAEGGTTEDETEIVSGGQSVVEGLNARDTFAMQALHGIFNNMEKDPATLSNSEMMFYCQQAYQWAANMMTVAASSRADLDDTTATETTQEAEVGALENNTEKLLNNLIVELEKTNEVEIDGEHSIYSERISIPKLIDFLNAYVADGSSTVGLKDLIDAINNISGGGSSSFTVVPYKYLNVTEAEGDGWTHNSNTWSKEGYADVSGAHTDEVAQTLPTWKNVQKISIVELPDLIQAVQNVADAITNQ